jgi:alpha/beta hydrolase family protein
MRKCARATWPCAEEKGNDMDVTGFDRIDVGTQSRPFLAAARADLEAWDYVEEEYVMSGQASVYRWPALEDLKVVGDAGYVTRVLVRRPANRAGFSGNVWMELLNPTFGYDVDFVWGLSHLHFIRHGDVCIGVTIKPIALTALRTFDERRYGSLTMDGGETGLAWDMIAALGGLLKNGDPRSPLPGWGVRCLGLTGYSQAAAYALVYMNAIAPWARTSSGEPIFDAYLPVAGSYGAVAIRGSEPVPPVGDPRAQFWSPAGAPVIVISTQADFATATTWERRTHRPADSDRPGRRIRLYEVAGAGHVSARMIRMLPPADDVRAAGCDPLDGWLYPPSDFPLHYVVETDDVGNAVGGVRTPFVDVPTATYLARTDHGPREIGLMIGHTIPFSRQFLRSLYATHDDYVADVTASVQQLVAARWLTAVDGMQIVDRAMARMRP